MLWVEGGVKWRVDWGYKAPAGSGYSDMGVDGMSYGIITGEFRLGAFPKYVGRSRCFLIQSSYQLHGFILSGMQQFLPIYLLSHISSIIANDTVRRLAGVRWMRRTSAG